MFAFKNLVKKKDNASIDKPFTIDLKRLDSYSFERLKDYITKYERFVEKMVAEIIKVRSENGQLLEDCQQLEEHLKDICDVNIDLNNNLMEADVRKDFAEILQISLLQVIEQLGGPKFLSLTTSTENLHVAITDLTAAINAFQQKMLTSQNGEDDFKVQIDRVTEQIENFIIDLGQKFKILNQGIETVEGSYDSLLKDFQKLYYSLSEHDEQNILEKFMLNDLVICSKKKLSSNGKAMSTIKKDLTVLKSEHGLLLKKVEKLEKESSGLRNRNQELEFKTAELKQSLDAISQIKNVNESEISGHLETLKILQQENYNLNMALQELRAKNLENDKQVLTLKKEKQVLNEKLNDIDTRNISALRQERLKLEQSKRDCEQLEQKLRDCETMLRSENIKYENLFKKYRDLKEAHKKSLENNDALRKVAKSFDGKSTAETQLKPPNNKNSEISSSHNESDNMKNTKTTDYGSSKQRSTVNYEQMANEIEDLKLTVVTSEIRIATERRVFDEMMQQKDEEIQALVSVGSLGCFRTRRPNPKTAEVLKDGPKRDKQTQYFDWGLAVIIV